MAKYVVNVIMTTCVEIEVEANDADEAQDIALEKADPFEADDWAYDIDGVFKDGDEYEEEENE